MSVYHGPVSALWSCLYWLQYVSIICHPRLYLSWSVVLVNVTLSFLTNTQKSSKRAKYSCSNHIDNSSFGCFDTGHWAIGLISLTNLAYMIPESSVKYTHPGWWLDVSAKIRHHMDLSSRRVAVCLSPRPPWSCARAQPLKLVVTVDAPVDQSPPTELQWPPSPRPVPTGALPPWIPPPEEDAPQQLQLKRHQSRSRFSLGRHPAFCEGIRVDMGRLLHG